MAPDYHITWIYPVAGLELLPVYLMLDEKRYPVSYDTAYDDNYIYSTFIGHDLTLEVVLGQEHHYSLISKGYRVIIA